MPVVFPDWCNTAMRAGIVVLSVGACAALAAPMIYVRTPWVTGQHQTVLQPIPFDHRHHVQDDGIACLYCHPAAETSAYAGVPATEVCMGCHAQVWPTSPQLALVRESWFTGRAIEWRRVSWVPDFVYFHHAVHVRHGVACAECHGAVEDMAQVEQARTLTMAFCLDCHRARQKEVARSITTCTACHR
jgi:hypothetical protein